MSYDDLLYGNFKGKILESSTNSTVEGYKNRQMCITHVFILTVPYIFIIFKHKLYAFTTLFPISLFYAKCDGMSGLCMKLRRKKEIWNYIIQTDEWWMNMYDEWQLTIKLMCLLNI